jgi:hypothetical protein
VVPWRFSTFDRNVQIKPYSTIRRGSGFAHRLGRLRESFSSVLDDPEARFELGLVLRTRGLA